MPSTDILSFMFKALSFLGLFLGETSSPDSSLLSLADIDVSTFKLARINFPKFL